MIDQLQPDLIIGNKEENYREGIEKLQEKFPVWISDIETLADALAMIKKVGELTGKNLEASRMATEIAARFKQLTLNRSPLSVAYFIWQKPYMVAASHTFIDHMLQTCGFTNVFAHMDRYPQISKEQLAEAKPQHILLSSEPYPFKDKHLQQFREICPEATVNLIDGEMFSWYGSRLLHSPAYFQRLINSFQY
jgi:ABC-type Fe3+-hydroxamate transport system substrate-binding protein